MTMAESLPLKNVYCQKEDTCVMTTCVCVNEDAREEDESSGPFQGEGTACKLHRV